MKVTSTGLIDGKFADRFGKRGTQFSKNGMSTYSIPLTIEDAPENTKSFAIIMEDKDAIPVCGFSWIHWTVANLTTTTLEENASQTRTDFIQGTNSRSGKLNQMSIEETSCYGGMAPPDAPHTYEVHVYALDTLLDIKPGFYMNELYKKMQGHILATTTLTGVYDN